MFMGPLVVHTKFFRAIHTFKLKPGKKKLAFNVRTDCITLRLILGGIISGRSRLQCHARMNAATLAGLEGVLVFVCVWEGGARPLE